MSKSKEMVGAPKCRLELRDRQQRSKTAEDATSNEVPRVPVVYGRRYINRLARISNVNWYKANIPV